MPEQHDTVIIGGGQAGLAMSAVLQQHGREHVVLERRRVGERWRTERWDSLRFQFPNWSVQLPGYVYSGDDPDGFADYRDISRLIENYAADIRAPVREHSEVLGLTEDDDGYVVSLAEASIRARRVVVATGPFQRPFVPPLAQDVAASVRQTDPTRYRCPEELPSGAVLVVGSGASGCQIADELVHAGRRVFLSVSRHRRAPRRLRGRDFYWWLEKMGRFAQTVDSLPDRRWPPSTVVTGVSGGYDVDVRRLVADGVGVVGRVVGASGATLSMAADANRILDEADQAYADFLAKAREVAGGELDVPEPVGAVIDEVDSLDLTRQNVTTIIWATGYSYDLGWLHVPVLDEQGRPVQRRGVTRRPGLSFLGPHWMHTFKSGLLAGVGSDAEYLAEHLDRSG
jgi:putative flavoprotein involved in K+ transport